MLHFGCCRCKFRKSKSLPTLQVGEGLCNNHNGFDLDFRVLEIENQSKILRADLSDRLEVRKHF
jgi:hypothetical protein